jgi:alkanesulfonate monooxygenase SsuD/methylene tetrahydromethanopterin reductase-like flavin-dependent oxidoreductase (luciferase family)
MAESLDRISAGRLILGLGAGATDPELHAFGLPIPSPRDKIAGLTDALHVIRGLWSQPTYTYIGTVYRTDAAEMEPKPARRIPIWLGTFGDRALAITGRYADGWIPSLGYAPLDQLPIMRHKVLAAAEAAGRDVDDVTCAVNLQIALDHHDPSNPASLNSSRSALRHSTSYPSARSSPSKPNDSPSKSSRPSEPWHDRHQDLAPGRPATIRPLGPRRDRLRRG